MDSTTLTLRCLAVCQHCTHILASVMPAPAIWRHVLPHSVATAATCVYPSSPVIHLVMCTMEAIPPQTNQGPLPDDDDDDDVIVVVYDEWITKCLKIAARAGLYFAPIELLVMMHDDDGHCCCQ